MGDLQDHLKNASELMDKVSGDLEHPDGPAEIEQVTTSTGSEPRP